MTKFPNGTGVVFFDYEPESGAGGDCYPQVMNAIMGGSFPIIRCMTNGEMRFFYPQYINGYGQVIFKDFAVSDEYNLDRTGLHLSMS